MSGTRAMVALMATLVGTSVVVAPAAALEPGVHIDPGSPAGKEYGLPLDQSRGAAVGHSAPQGVTQPLFGVGISPAGAGAVTSGSGSVGHAAKGRGSKGPSSGGTSAGSTGSSTGSATNPAVTKLSPPQIAALTNLARPKGTTSQTLLLGIPVVLGGLLAGIAIAAAARRRT